MVFRLSFHQKKDSARALLHGDSGVIVMLTPLSLALVLPFCFCFCFCFLGYMRHKTQGRHTGHTNIRGCIPKWQGAGLLGAGIHTSIHGHACYFGMLVHTNMLRAGMLVCLCYWGAPQHCSMPTTRVLTCWGACQQHRQTILSLLPRWLATDQHASMSRLGGAAMLGCMPAA